VRNGKKVIDPTQTQPLSWRMHQGKALPLEEVPVDPTNRQAPSFDDSPPDRLPEAGYRLRARLGHGRLGPIYEAQDELSRISGSQHFAAVLLVDDRIASRPGFDADFERGGAELKSIAHPNIVKLLEYGRDNNRYYLVNELLESASLRFVLSDAGTLPPAESTAVLRAVGDALQYLHAKGIVHGNLRPENVLVTFGYEVKLLDIVPNGWLVNPNDALGVPARAPDKRDDVFGLACLAYEMLSGRHPYNGNTAQEAYRAGLEAEPIDNCTDRQWRALANALSVHRDDRTPNVAQFLDEFGVSVAQKLKTVVTADAPPPARAAPAYAAPTYSAPEPPPAIARPVVAERAVRGAPERRGIIGTLVMALLVIGAGIAAWYYQEPLRTFASDLATEVETQMSREAPAARTDAPPASTTAPLEQAPAVTDDTPATVLAPGASVPEPREPATPQPEVVASADTAASRPRAAAPQPEPATDLPPPAREIVAPPPPREQVVPASPAPAPAAVAGPTRFSFQQDVVTVRESDVAARLVIRRSGSLAGAASVSWWTADETAQANADYADLGARIERFAAGEASRTVFVPLTNDAVGEPVKSFRVMLGAVEGESTAGRLTGETRVDIVDDD
jgi:hypothetical protein